MFLSAYGQSDTASNYKTAHQGSARFGNTIFKDQSCHITCLLLILRWFGHQPLESKQSVQRVNLYTPYRAQALAWGAFFVQYASIVRGDRTDAVALLRFCETMARYSTKMTIFGSILRFSGKTRTVTPNFLR